MDIFGYGTGQRAARHVQNLSAPCFCRCGQYTQEAVKSWLRIGGRRLDAANSYYTQVDVALAMKASGVPREDIFLLQKTGNPNPMGYNGATLARHPRPPACPHAAASPPSVPPPSPAPADTLRQTAAILAEMGTPYVDLLLNHWPTSPGASTDPACEVGAASYDERTCRLDTWRAYVEVREGGDGRRASTHGAGALTSRRGAAAARRVYASRSAALGHWPVQVWRKGQARAIGVANYNSTHLQVGAVVGEECVTSFDAKDGGGWGICMC